MRAQDGDHGGELVGPGLAVGLPLFTRPLDGILPLSHADVLFPGHWSYLALAPYYLVMEKSTYEDVLYEVDGPAAVITINREERLNAFRGQTIEELIHAFKRAWADKSVRGVIFTGAGTGAFCVGGDVKQRAETGDYGPTSNGLFEVIYLHRLIRDVPKPVIAAVNGLAIGGGHVLHVLCDLPIAAEHARFGQAGPRVGSFDGGFGSAYLARVVGEKRAREIWFLLEQDIRPSRASRAMGPGQSGGSGRGRIQAAKAWVNQLAQYSPTAIRFLKHYLKDQHRPPRQPVSSGGGGPGRLLLRHRRG